MFELRRPCPQVDGCRQAVSVDVNPTSPRTCPHTASQASELISSRPWGQQAPPPAAENTHPAIIHYALNIRSRLQSDRHDVPDGFDWYEQSHAPHSRTSTSESYTSQLDSSRLSTGTSVPLPVPDQYYQHHRYRPKARGTMQYRYRYAVDCTVPVPVYSTAVSCMAVYCKPYWYTTYYTGIGIPYTVHWESDNTDSHTAIRHIYVVYGIYTVHRYRY